MKKTLFIESLQKCFSRSYVVRQIISFSNIHNAYSLNIHNAYSLNIHTDYSLNIHNNYSFLKPPGIHNLNNSTINHRLKGSLNVPSANINSLLQSNCNDKKHGYVIRIH